MSTTPIQAQDPVGDPSSRGFAPGLTPAFGLLVMLTCYIVGSKVTVFPHIRTRHPGLLAGSTGSEEDKSFSGGLTL
ncbi:MAG: hypothetical protein ACYTKC_22580 [Planctomycetota bacterium]|jgi:hypothetical protein